MSITITLIIPVYNVEKYLAQCLDSVVGQSVPFDEVILINDGSVDKSLSICERYILKYDCFKLINQRNQGLSAARNTGLNYAAGKYVMFLDSDDILRLNMVSRLKDELENHHLDAVYFDADIQCESGFMVNKNIYDRDIKEIAGIKMNGWEFFLRCYPENYIVSACMAVYKKSIIENAGILFPEGLYYEDNYFSFMFMNRAECVTYIPEKLYIRRYRKDSITTSGYSERKFTDHIKIVLLVWEEVSKKAGSVLSEHNSILLKFVNNCCSVILNNYGLCKEQKIVLSEDAESYLYRMAESYEMLLEQFHLKDKAECLTLLNFCLKNLKQISLFCPANRKNTEQMIKKIIEKQKHLYRTLLCNLPLNQKRCKVGIYGTGKHTEGLLAVYEYLIGKITCDLIFLDSYKTNGIYRDRTVIHYQQVDKSFDLIIISSFLYEQEMIENVRRINKKVPIFTFYTDLKEDIFSVLDLFCFCDIPSHNEE